MKTSALDYVVVTLIIVGAINWGLIGFFNLNVISLIFGSMSLISRIIYAIVGICGLYSLTFYGRIGGNE